MSGSEAPCALRVDSLSGCEATKDPSSLTPSRVASHAMLPETLAPYLEPPIPVAAPMQKRAVSQDAMAETVTLPRPWRPLFDETEEARPGSHSTPNPTTDTSRPRRSSLCSKVPVDAPAAATPKEKAAEARHADTPTPAKERMGSGAVALLTGSHGIFHAHT